MVIALAVDAVDAVGLWLRASQRVSHRVPQRQRLELRPLQCPGAQRQRAVKSVNSGRNYNTYITYITYITITYYRYRSAQSGARLAPASDRVRGRGLALKAISKAEWVQKAIDSLGKL